MRLDALGWNRKDEEQMLLERTYRGALILFLFHFGAAIERLTHYSITRHFQDDRWD